MTKLLRFLFIVYLCSAVFFSVAPVSAAYPPTTTVTILTMGDSNTAGVGNPDLAKNESTMIGFRKPLKDLLTTDGVITDFLGSQNAGSSVFSDTQHEGYLGAWSDHMIEKVDAGMLTNYPAQIITLLIGPNDFNYNIDGVRSNPQVLNSKYQILVEKIHAVLPDSHVIIIKPGTEQSASMNVHRVFLDELVAQKQLAGWSVSSVDAINAANDGTHYTPAGHTAIGTLLYQEIKRILGSEPMPTVTIAASPTIELSPTGIITPTSSICIPSDLDCSGKVNAADLTILLTAFGSSDASADLDASGTVNAIDVTILLSSFGK